MNIVARSWLAIASASRGEHNITSHGNLEILNIIECDCRVAETYGKFNTIGGVGMEGVRPPPPPEAARYPFPTGPPRPH